MAAPQAIQLSTAIREYIAHSATCGVASNTTKVREAQLAHLYRSTGDIQVRALSSAHLDRMYRAHGAWSANTANLNLIMLRQFFAWCRNRKWMAVDCDPTFGRKLAKVPRAMRQRIPVDEWPILFDACRTPVETVTIALGLFLFLRKSEITALRLRHIDLKANLATIWRQKTQEWDEMPIPAELGEILRHYLTWYTTQLQRQGIAVHPDFFVVAPRKPGARGQDPATGRLAVTQDADINPHKSFAELGWVLNPVLDRAGMNGKGEGLHLLRRSGARAYYDYLVDDLHYDGALRRVATCLGHKNTITTEIYLGIELDRAQRNKELAGKLMFGGRFKAKRGHGPDNVVALKR